MTVKSTRWPARLDMIQGGTGFILVLFMWAHMFFVASILLGEDAMYWVARMFEGQPLFGEPYPALVSIFAIIIFSLIAVHALLAMRKFPANYPEYSNFYQHMRRFKHGDTLLWYIQIITGFALFFLASIHLYQLMTHPADIGPYASSDRVWTGNFWPLYLVLLFIVEFHAGIGIYRLVIKWGFFLGRDAKKARQRLQIIKWLITVFFLVLGVATLAAYMKIGAAHAGQAGERYQPVHSQTIQKHQQA